MGRDRGIQVESFWKMWILVGGFIARLQLPCGMFRVRLALKFPSGQARLVTVNIGQQEARRCGIRVDWIRFLTVALIGFTADVRFIQGDRHFGLRMYQSFSSRAVIR